jgi:glutamate-ammonia-ligase adenylyltransferase
MSLMRRLRGRARRRALARSRGRWVARRRVCDAAAHARGAGPQRRALFDLKQGDGGLVDLEFLLQYLVLRDSRTHARLRTPRASPAILDALHDAGLLDANTRAALQVAHATLLDAGLRCTLDRRPRRVALDERITLAREAIRDAVRAQGLQFEASGDR